MEKGESEATSESGSVRGEIRELTDKGFSQKEIFTLFYQRARWRTRLENECAGEPTLPPSDSSN